MRGCLHLMLALACALGACKACDDEETLDVCTRVDTVDGPRHECATHQTYARCVAHLLEGKLSWCRYSGPLDTTFYPVKQDLFDVRRATAAEEAFIRDKCPVKDLSSGVAGVDGTRDILVCPQDRLAQCMAYQRGGSTFICVAEDAKLAEFGLLRPHQNMLRVDLAKDTYEESNTTHGRVWAKFSLPGVPASDRVCDPMVCPDPYCDRACVDLHMNSVVVGLEDIPVGGLFALWRPDKQPCPASKSLCECYDGSAVGVGAINESQEIEAEICRETARVRGQTNTTFSLDWSHTGRVEGLFCYRDPYTDGNACGFDCGIARTGTYFAVPYKLGCQVTGVPDCTDDAEAGNHSPATASLGAPGTHSSLRLCTGHNDWFKVDLCAGGSLTASVTSDSDHAVVGLFKGEPAAPDDPLPTDVQGREVSYTSTSGDVVYVRVALTQGFEETYSLTLSVTGCGATPDGGADAGPDADAGACADVSGKWNMVVSNVTSSCGPEPSWSSLVTITQSGCGSGALQTVGIKQSTHFVPGSVVGKTVTIGPGDFAEGSGTTTATYTMTVTSGTTMSGHESWTYSDSASKCVNGTADVTATRQ